MQNINEIRIRPIGYVKTEAEVEEIEAGRAVAEIVVSKDLTEALNGIEEFSHIFVLYWMHQVRDSDLKRLKDHPKGRLDLPLRGALATRTARRPNPIGLTLVELLERKENILVVKGLDAIDGTPVLDIKPFDQMDFVQRARYPDWWPVVER